MAALAAVFCVAASAAASPRTSPDDFLITDLPGLAAQPSFKQYAGYMPIGDVAGTEVFFWFVEAESNPATAPVALWMNGGPGASSVGYGFWTEHGPFRLSNESGTPTPAPYEYAWNKLANVLYIEAPKGVGFSFTRDTSGYENITDAESSSDNYKFLLAWFEVFSQFKSNPFFVTAESYGGHYGPTLAEQILENPNDINMKGLLIGNPGINSDWYYNVDEFAFVTFMWSHGLIPASNYAAAKSACGWDTFYTDCARDYTHPTAECLAATRKATSYIPSPIDPFDVLAPACLDRAGVEAVEALAPGLAKLGAKYGIEFNPCLSRLTPTYMNRPDVLKAIHADTHYNRTWPQHPANWGYNEGPAGAKKDIALLFPKFFAKAPHWKIAVVSGTADSAVPFVGSERWIGCLGRRVVNDTRGWLLDGQVAGTVTDWDGISLVTVKGCGHMIPLYCPEAGLAFFANWLSGNW